METKQLVSKLDVNSKKVLNNLVKSVIMTQQNNVKDKIELRRARKAIET